MTEATTKTLGPCQVRSKTEHPCDHQAVVRIQGVPFCEACALEQEAYFALGEPAGEARSFGDESPVGAKRIGLQREAAPVEAMHEDQLVFEMANWVLCRQATIRVEGTGEPFEEAMDTVLETEPGRQLAELRDGPHRAERADRWQAGLAPRRASERKQTLREERGRDLQEAAWKLLIRTEMRELELHKDGRFVGVLDRMRGTDPAVSRRIASENRKRDEERLVVLMDGAKLS